MNNRKSRAVRPGIASRRTVAIAVLGAVFLSIITFATRPALAQSIDLPRSDVVEQLDTRYAEKQAAVGVTDVGGVIEVFTTNDGSTWTLVLTKTDGTSRVIAAGETWIRR
jgi:hypothetical protein